MGHPTEAVAATASVGLRVALVALMAIFVGILGGCAGYQMQGTVIEGPISMVQVVSASDVRLKAAGSVIPVSDATIEVVVDPSEMKPQRLAPIASDDRGTFALGTDATGAGFLEYEIRVVASKPGFQTAVATLPMPGSGKRLLITLSPGRDSYRPTKDILRETQEAGDALSR